MRLLLSVWGGLVLLIASACSPASGPPAAATQAPASTPAATTAGSSVVKVGLLTSLTSGPYYIAQERGYFRDYGIDVNDEVFDTGAKMVPSLATGGLDVGSGAISAGLFNAVSRDISLKLVAQQASSTPGHGNIAMFVRKDLIDSGAFKDYPDMKGKKVAITAKASQSEVLLDHALQKGGLQLSDVEEVELGVGDMAAAFTTKNLDIGFINEPTATATVDKGFAVRWKGGDEIYPSQLFTTWMYSEKFARERPEVGVKFMAAIMRGTRDFIDAFDKGKDKSAIVDIMVRHTPVTDRGLYDRMVTAGMDPNGVIDTHALEADEDWYVSHGQVSQKVSVQDFVDPTFVERAAQLVGPYQP
jgi:NitT/TauT family transport system substrate-binding protein